MDPRDPSAAARKESGKTALSQKDNKAKGWFLTYPQCPCPKEDCLADLRDSLALQDLAIDEYLICEEKHKDGNPHLHAFIKLDKRVRFKSSRFDIIYEGKTYHGEYEIAKSWNAVKKYITKDGNYISNFDPESAAKKQSKKIGIKELEMDALDLLDQGVITGMQLNNFIKNQNVYMFLKQKRERAKQKIDFEIPKQRHIWIYGDSNTGKTMELKANIAMDPNNWFQIPTNNDWIGYNGEKNLYIDEYKGQLTIQELNRICDGGAKVNVKGGSTVLRNDVIVWICSNFSIKECYNKAEAVLLEALYNRFNEKYKMKTIEEKERLDNLISEAKNHQGGELHEGGANLEDPKKMENI